MGFGWLIYKTNTVLDDVAAKSRGALAWRLHRVRGVCGGSPQDCWVLRATKSSLEARRGVKGILVL
jgi:hypothetical protein